MEPIPVAAWSKALVCGRSPAGVVGSNPEDVRACVRVVCVCVRVVCVCARACVCVILRDQVQQQPSTPTTSR
jgi:hypothetical protein